MAGLIKTFANKAGSAVSGYTPSWLKKGYQLLSSAVGTVVNLPETLERVEKVAVRIWNPTEWCEKSLRESLQSFSLKTAIQAPLTPKTIRIMSSYLRILLDNLHIPCAEKIEKAVEQALRQPLDLNKTKKAYDYLVTDILTPAVTETNVKKVTALFLETTRELVHAVAETKRDNKTELLHQLGIKTTFEEFKKTTKKEVRNSIEVLFKNLPGLLNLDQEDPVEYLALSLVCFIVGGIINLFTSTILESLYQYGIPQFLDKNGDFSFKGFGIEFKIPKAELDHLRETYSNYREILFWAFLKKFTEGLSHFKDRTENVDEEWMKFVDEFQPIISQTLFSTADRVAATSTWGKPGEFLMRQALNGWGYLEGCFAGKGVTVSLLKRFKPSGVIPTLVQGLQTGFNR